MTDPGFTVLLVSRDDGLLDEVQRLAAAAGVVPEVAGQEAVALRAWGRAEVVLVGADLADGLALLRPPRRAGVHVVSRGEAQGWLFRSAVVLGAESVLELGAAADWLGQLFSELGDPRPPGRVLAVMPGSGGAGATTLACALAQVGSAHGPVLLMDTDPLGPGADRVLGLDGVPGLRWDALAGTSGRLSGASLRDSVPRRGQLGVLTWGGPLEVEPSAGVLRETLEAARRAHDLVVVDLPRRAGPATSELLTRCDRLLVVVRPTLTGVAAATRQVAALEGRGALVVRGRGLSPETVARAVGAEVLAEVPEQRGMEESVDLGLGPVRGGRGALGRAAARLLSTVDRGWAA
ncbi:septum site-determining protein Ssd [Nocardioides houyundeii]|uniref:septum site-determining protein Ssd n=1 Tax=Nocardioides houyundeii TaxID=2045452 RepID=UPI000C7938D8|nr:septum site-determining protein Ssd [Nocardioides houyundeii]